MADHNIEDVTREVTKKVYGKEQTDYEMTPTKFYILDENLESAGVKYIKDINKPIDFDVESFFRIYFGEQDNLNCPYLDIFFDSEGKKTLQFHFLKDINCPMKLEKFESYVLTRKFLDIAHDRFGDFEVSWEGPGSGNLKTPSYLGIYYDDKIAFSYLIFKLSKKKTYQEVYENFRFLRASFEESIKG